MLQVWQPQCHYKHLNCSFTRVACVRSLQQHAAAVTAFLHREQETKPAVASTHVFHQGALQQPVLTLGLLHALCGGVCCRKRLLRTAAAAQA